MEHNEIIKILCASGLVIAAAFFIIPYIIYKIKENCPTSIRKEKGQFIHVDNLILQIIPGADEEMFITDISRLEQGIASYQIYMKESARKLFESKYGNKGDDLSDEEIQEMLTKPVIVKDQLFCQLSDGEWVWWKR